MAWKAGAFPVTFAVIGDALPQGRRAMAFSVQSVLVRLPRVIGAPLGGLLIASFGVVTGVRIAAGITLLLALIVLVTQQRGYREQTDAERVLKCSGESDPRANAGRAETAARRGMSRAFRRSHRRGVHRAVCDERARTFGPDFRDCCTRCNRRFRW